MRLAGHGLSVELPPGWEGRIVQRPPGGPVLHLASFPLRASDGDFGSAATGRMRPGDTFAALLEYRDPAMIRPGVGLFEELGQPVPRPQDFSPNQLQVTRPGQFGWQRFFTAAGRPSCLYAVVHPAGAGSAALVEALARVLVTIERAGNALPPVGAASPVR